MLALNPKYFLSLACVPVASLALATELLFREDWAEIPAALPITAEHLANPDLALYLYGGAREGLKKSHHPEINNDPFYVWSGEIKSDDWAATLRAKDGTTYDLSNEGSLTWRTRQSGVHCLRIVLRTLGGDWLVSEPLVCVSQNWQVTTHVLSELEWEQLGANDPFSATRESLQAADLSRIVEIGFTDLRAGSGSGASSRVDWIEVHGKVRLPVCPVSSIEGSDEACPDGPMASMDGHLGTRWFAEGAGAMLTATLENISQVSCIEIAWWKGDERSTTFEVLTSLDGETWQVAIPLTGSSGEIRDFECYDFPKPMEAQFVRIIGHENTINKWNSIVEWRVRGTFASGNWYDRYDPVDGWCEIPSIGWVCVDSDPWLWHGQLTWLYVQGVGEGLFCFYDYGLGWIWTSETYFPLIYAYETDTWFWFGGGPNPRWFYNSKSGSWENH